ncbi:uncharacterized protein B0I36DRAFT_360605 [Microdochium trichocladiopsis]|uniref:Nudix hydrolase domain-containing protein n=1 Tax=Microdochium trichocladiopsis TaxID=1682393 RepID=A0A9P8YC32_9PEZI|nr:uncharacterized protein B0I36DRAFT_360605 [Microdochium trichocladiopsis]KAH7035200.1 hypothetical protein B0I36DRAFT_360605 [Microdochium trichocladiopsis]
MSSAATAAAALDEPVPICVNGDNSDTDDDDDNTSSASRPRYNLRSRRRSAAQLAIAATPALTHDDDDDDSAPVFSAQQQQQRRKQQRHSSVDHYTSQSGELSSGVAADLLVVPSGGASSYWDVTAMAPLSPVSAAAIARLRAYRPPPFPTWDRLPVSRRAAVLVLLYADRRGDLRVVITMRAASLRSSLETGYQIARREAWEEIGLPLDEAKLPKPFRIEALCDLPCSLARTEIAVRPCVAFLHADDIPPDAQLTGNNNTSSQQQQSTNLVEEAMMPRLDAKEVAAVFSAPLHNFLLAQDRDPLAGEKPLPSGHWYDGRWTRWHGKPWRVHNFHVPVNDQRVVRPKVRESGQAALADRLDDYNGSGSGGGEDSTEELLDDQRFLVWGMTGRIIVDVARVAYGVEPQFEHNEHYGDEEIISRLEAAGLLGEKKRNEVGQEAIKEVVKDEKM